MSDHLRTVDDTYRTKVTIDLICSIHLSIHPSIHPCPFILFFIYCSAVGAAEYLLAADRPQSGRPIGAGDRPDTEEQQNPARRDGSGMDGQVRHVADGGDAVHDDAADHHHHATAAAAVSSK